MAVMLFNILGAIAQLVERLHGMQEVSGSSPLGSTKLFGFLVIITKINSNQKIKINLFHIFIGLRVAGNFIIGVYTQKYGQDAFRKEIYNTYLDINNLEYPNLIQKIIINFFDSKNINQINKNNFE